MDPIVQQKKKLQVRMVTDRSSAGSQPYGLGSTNGAQKSEISRNPPQNRRHFFGNLESWGWEVDTKYGKTYSTMIIS